jgi:hypothetical protein
VSSQPRLGSDPAYTVFKEDVQQRLWQRVSANPLLASHRGALAFGAEAEIQEAEQAKNADVAALLRKFAGQDAANEVIGDVFRREADFVYNQSRKRYGARHGATARDIANETEAPRAFFMFLPQQVQERIDQQAAVRGDLLTHWDYISLGKAIRDSAAELSRQPEFARFSPEEAARRVTERTLGKALADRELEGKMPLVRQTLQEMQPALMKAHEETAVAMGITPKSHPDQVSLHHGGDHDVAGPPFTPEPSKRGSGDLPAVSAVRIRGA